MREIELTQGKVTQVDDEDYEWLNQWKWHVVWSKKRPYACWTGRNVDGKRGPVWMHKKILAISSDKQGDHIDGNSLNNQRKNLRPCTNHQNSMNKQPTRGAYSKYKGVTFRKCQSKWRARIRVRNQLISLGQYETEIMAAKAYDTAALKHFEEFARINQYAEN